MDKTFMGLTEYDLDELYSIVSYTFEETLYPLSGPKSLEKAVMRYSNTCGHTCLSSIKEHDDLAKKCGQLSGGSVRGLIDRVYNPNRENEWDLKMEVANV